MAGEGEVEQVVRHGGDEPRPSVEWEAPRVSDCRHDREPGCAVQAAVASGLVPQARVGSYAELREELARNAERSDAHAAHDTKRKWKTIHKSARDRRKLHHKLGLKGD